MQKHRAVPNDELLCSAMIRNRSEIRREFTCVEVHGAQPLAPLSSFQPRPLCRMDGDELIGSTTAIFIQAIATAREWYLSKYAGGTPSSHLATAHQEKFIGGNGLENIYCSSQNEADWPEGDVKEKMEQLNSKLVRDLGAQRTPFFERYQREVRDYSESYAKRE